LDGAAGWKKKRKKQLIAGGSDAVARGLGGNLRGGDHTCVHHAFPILNARKRRWGGGKIEKVRVAPVQNFMGFWGVRRNFGLVLFVTPFLLAGKGA